jgi:CDGSH-type Zn-finger protein
VTLIDPTGATIRIEREYVSLCRCGHSARKPFCDSSHKRVGFQAEEPCPQD